MLACLPPLPVHQPSRPCSRKYTAAQKAVMWGPTRAASSLEGARRACRRLRRGEACAAPAGAWRARRCLRRGEELRLPHLAAYARLALARFALQHRLAPPDAHLRAERALPAPELGARGGLARPSRRQRAPPVFQLHHSKAMGLSVNHDPVTALCATCLGPDRVAGAALPCGETCRPARSRAVVRQRVRSTLKLGRLALRAACCAPFLMRRRASAARPVCCQGPPPAPHRAA
jgi:hypothetical protein